MLFMVTLATARAETLPPAPSTAPPLHECKTQERVDLGTWDDVLVLDAPDTIILKRGGDLFTLSAEHLDQHRLATAPAVSDAELIGGAEAGGDLWLVMNSRVSVPFAFNARTGAVVPLEVPGLKTSRDKAPVAGAPIFLKSSGAALVAVTGGHSENWPQDEGRNLTLYFWFGLKTGKVVPVPAGWDLEYFSADQTLAVFAKPSVKRFERRPLQAVDLRTGEPVENGVPDRRTTPVINLEGKYKAGVQAIGRRRENTSQYFWLDGLSVDGVPFPAPIGADGEYALASAKARDGFAAFQRIREGGKSPEFQSTLWLMPLNASPQAVPIAEGVHDNYALLDAGGCVYATVEGAGSGKTSEAFFYSNRDGATWNVLDGVERLPEPPAGDSIENTMSVRFIGSFGGKEHPALVLGLFRQSRDQLDFMPARRPDQWARAVLVTSGGERYMTDLFRENAPPDHLWLHDSGRLFVGKDLYQDSGKQIHLSAVTLSW